MFAHAAQPLGLIGGLADNRSLTSHGDRTFGHDHDRKVGAARLTFHDHLGHGLEAIRDLRNQDGVGPSGDTGVESNPTRVTTHHFDHEHSAV